MKMNGTIEIQRPVDTVYEYVCEVTNDVNWRTGVTASGLRSDPPLGEGSIGFAQAGEAVTEYRIVELIPGERVDWDLISGPFQGRGGYRFKETPNGTLFTLVADLEPAGAYRFLGPIFGWIGRRQNQSDVEKLRRILESDSD